MAVPAYSTELPSPELIAIAALMMEMSPEKRMKVEETILSLHDNVVMIRGKHRKRVASYAALLQEMIHGRR